MFPPKKPKFPFSEVAQFLADNPVDDNAAALFRAATPEIQESVIRRGNLRLLALGFRVSRILWTLFFGTSIYILWFCEDKNR